MLNGAMRSGLTIPVTMPINIDFDGHIDGQEHFDIGRKSLIAISKGSLFTSLNWQKIIRSDSLLRQSDCFVDYCSVGYCSLH